MLYESNTSECDLKGYEKGLGVLYRATNPIPDVLKQMRAWKWRREECMSISIYLVYFHRGRQRKSNDTVPIHGLDATT